MNKNDLEYGIPIGLLVGGALVFCVGLGFLAGPAWALMGFGAAMFIVGCVVSNM